MNYPKFISIVLFVFLLSIVGCYANDEQQQQQLNNNGTQEIKTSVINLDSLPDLFSNDKLPNSQQETNRCFDLLGCIQSMPVGREPQEVDKLLFSFKIYRRNTQDSKVILFDRHKVCLSGDSERCQIYPYDLNLLLNSTFDPRSRTIIVVPGFRSHFETNWQTDIKDRWLKLENVNVITVGWNGGNQGIYETAVANTKVVARQLTVLLYYLASLSNLNLQDDSFTERILFVGHSLGAHISGFVGKDLNGLIGRISGLDAAGPEFNDAPKEFRLDKGDARLVDAIHSNGCPLSMAKPCFGIEKPIAHLDYYANDGKHQPQCSFDAFGCSHGASIDYYRSFLDHEIYTRQYLALKYHKCYRLFAIPSYNYEEFHNGISLAKLCPITSLDDYDLYSKDVDNCTLPIDFVTWYDKFRKELIDNYNVDFNTTDTSYDSNRKKYFFYTSPAYPYINNHNFIKIRITKLEQTVTQPKVCDLMLHVRMASGAWMKNQFKSYQLIDKKDHYEILLPYISTDSASKYELARLDANDFYLSDDDDYFKLETGIKAAFPERIELLGIEIEKNVEKKKKGFLDAIKNFFGLAKKNNDEIFDKSKLHECSLNVETITIQPLKKIHRHFVASYSLNGQQKEKPNLIILKENDTSPKIDLLHGSANINKNIIEPNLDIEINSEIYIDTVVIGPRDNTIDTDADDDDNYDDNLNNNENQTASINNNNSMTTGGVVWLVLTILMGAAIMIILSIVGILYVKRRRLAPQEERVFIHEEHLPSFDNF